MADVKKKKPTGKGNGSPAGNGAKKKAAPQKKSNAVMIAVILGVFAIFLMLCLVVNLFCNPHNELSGNPSEHTFKYVGFWVCNIFLGVFGPLAFAIPVLIGLGIFFGFLNKELSYVIKYTVLSFVFVLLANALVHVFVTIGNEEAYTFYVDLLFEGGAALEGGGVLGGLLAYGGIAVAGRALSAIVLLVGILLLLPSILGGSVSQVVTFAFCKIRDYRDEHAEEREEEKERRREEREQARLERKEERERERAERAAAKAAAYEEDEDEVDEDEDGEEEPALKPIKLKNKAEPTKRDEVKVRNAEDADAAEAADERKPANKIKLKNSDELPEENEEAKNGGEDKIKLTVFSRDDIKHIDDLKDGEHGEELSSDELDELGAERVFPANEEDDDDADAIVFVDPKDNGNKARGHKAVDDLFSERFFEDNITVDKNTGEVFTPAVQNKAPKSAAEFEEMNSKDEEYFIGDKPESVVIPEYVFPPVDLLQQGPAKYSSDPKEIEENAEQLQRVLQDFRIPIKEISYSCGPTITRYEIKPEAGVRVKQIANLVDDISMALARSGVRIEAPIPGKAAVGIEVPNEKPAAVKLRNLIETTEFTEHKSKLASCLGADVSGKPVVFDIEKMPHLLVAGTTGSGKSVCINSIIMSILYHAKPSEVKLLLIDPKKVEFKIYKDIPHLCCRIISDPKKAAGALNSAVNEMEKRFELIEEVGVRNITGYNEATKNDPDKPFMPRMVIIIDEFADLMMTAKDEVETAVVRIAQKARAAGIHLIIGTQRPSVDVITGLIKANVPSRIAFTVMSQVDSRTILDGAGAEKLCGRGDMLYAPVGASKPQRVQGAFVSDEEVEAVVEFVKGNNAPVIYDQEFEMSIDNEAAKCGNAPDKSGGGDFKGGSGDDDPKLFEAAELAIDAGKISTSLLQRRLEVGYGRAAKIIDRLEEMGFVGPADGNKPRKILVTREELAEHMMNDK